MNPAPPPAPVAFSSAGIMAVPPREAFPAPAQPAFGVLPAALVPNGDRIRQMSAARVSAGSTTQRIGPGDLLAIRVFEVPELSSEVRVARNGIVQLPLIGAVEVQGRNAQTLSDELAGRFRKYVKNPQVAVFVKENESQQVAVTGAVARPGLYPLNRENYTILDALSEAGGLTEKAGNVISFIPATQNSMPALQLVSSSPSLTKSMGEPILINLKEFLTGQNREVLNLPVVAGDIVFVPESGSFTLEGWVERPGTYVLTRETTVLAALSAGGGPHFAAKLGAVEILRTRGDGNRDAFMADLDAIRAGTMPDVELRSGDVVRVPPSAVKVVPWGVYSFVQNLFHVGASMPLL
jgi:polysaccharide export outer membrane protein